MHQGHVGPSTEPRPGHDENQAGPRSRQPPFSNHFGWMGEVRAWSEATGITYRGVGGGDEESDQISRVGYSLSTDLEGVLLQLHLAGQRQGLRTRPSQKDGSRSLTKVWSRGGSLPLYGKEDLSNRPCGFLTVGRNMTRWGQCSQDALEHFIVWGALSVLLYAKRMCHAACSPIQPQGTSPGITPSPCLQEAELPRKATPVPQPPPSVCCHSTWPVPSAGTSVKH